MKRGKSASGRGWELLQLLITARAKKAGPDGDLGEMEQGEEIQAAAEGARRLLKDPVYMRVRLKAMEQVLVTFNEWLALDPAHPNYQRELVGLHMKAAPRWWELFWPEELIHQETEHRSKSEEKEEHGGKGLRKGR